MPVSKHILLISYDERRLIDRRKLLEREGYTISSAFGFKEAMGKCRDGALGSCDLVVLGHSIPFADKRQLIRAFRVNVGAPILCLLMPHEPVESGVDYVAFSDSPAKLLYNVATILARSAAKASS